MSESQPNHSNQSNASVLMFMVVLSLVCALILAVLASALAKPKEIAKDLDRNKQLMIAAKILDHDGHFLIEEKPGHYVPAKYAENGAVVAAAPSKRHFANQAQLLDVYKTRIKALLVNDQGEVTTFDQAKLDEDRYTAEYKKTGYYKQPWKLIYEILPNPEPDGEAATKTPEPIGYVIPISGFGLWDAIYGYLAIKPDADTVMGISWYDQKETPGLGGNIAEASWQQLFSGKLIFQESSDGTTNFKKAPLGITVVKGKVVDVLGNSPKAKSAVDGMAGATLTGNGVTDAYRDVLAAYRPFLIRAHASDEQQKKGGR